MATEGNIKIDRVLENVVCVTVRLSRPGLNRTISSKTLSVDADADMISAQKRLFESPELDRVQKQDGRIRRWLYCNALPGNIGDGVYVFPVGMVERAEEVLGRMFEQREELAEAATKVYPIQYREAKSRLRELWDERDYLSPESYRASFRAVRTYVRLAAPDTLQKISQDLYNQKNRELEGVWSEVIAEIRQEFRQMFTDLTAGLVDRLMGGDGKTKRLTQPAMDKLMRFVDDFKIKDVTNDRDLAKLVEQFRKLISGTDAKELRTDEPLRNRVREETQKLVTYMEKNLEVRPSRRISLDEEEA